MADLPREEQARMGRLPTSLQGSLQALEQDHEFLLRGGVFSEDMIQAFITAKMTREYEEVRKRPHPYEMSLYFDC